MRLARMVAAVLAPLLLVIVVPPAAADDLVQVTDASGRVACLVVPVDDHNYQASVRCDLLGGAPASSPLPPRDRGCPVDWSATATLAEGELARWGACVGDSVAGGGTLAPGAVVGSGDISCTGLDAGISCVDTSSGYGFRLTPAAMTPIRPAGRSLLSPAGLGKLRLGMTKARARRTGYLGAATCGSPQLKERLGLTAWLEWRRGRFDGVLANHHSNVQTKKGVGVGSSLKQVRRQYRGRVVRTTDQVEGQPAHVYEVRGKRGRLVFIMETPSTRSPAASDLVGAIWLTTRWSPKRGFGFSGC